MDALLIPLQRKLAVVRPRQRCRGTNVSLNVAYFLICVYQYYLFTATVLMRLVEVGFSGVSSGSGGLFVGYWLSYDMIFGWDEFRKASPPLL